MRFALALLGVTALVPTVAAAAPEKPPQLVRGDVVAVSGDALDVRTRDNREAHLKLPAQVSVAQVEQADASAIADGAFIGTKAVAQPDGTLQAVEVHVFPEAMRGTGEGHRPSDLGPGSSMTNATVSGMSARQPGDTAQKGSGSSSMTNATVSGMSTTGETRTLTLRYAGGEQTVVVPPDIPVFRIAPGDRSLLTPGAHVIAFTVPQDDGTLLVQRAMVGKGAVVPPM